MRRLKFVNRLSGQASTGSPDPRYAISYVPEALELSRTEMNADRQLTIDWIITLHLRVKCPPTECLDSSSRQLAMLARFQHHNGDLGMLRDQQASLHPIIELLSIERSGNSGPGSGLGHRA